jgi:hypothetical protein
MSESIRRRDVEANARDYLERVRRLGSDGSVSRSRLDHDQFEDIVRREVDTTIRQLRGLGRIVED